MKNILRYLWFRATTQHGDLVVANTVPIVAFGETLKASVEVVGVYTTCKSSYSVSYLKDLNMKAFTHCVQTKTIKKISATKNPEYFI